MPSDYDDVIVINEGYETRTSKTGKTRATVVVRSEPIAVNLNAKELGRPVALAIAQHIKQSILGIATQAAKNTIRARQTALKAFVLGKPWAMKRYSGGRTGSKPPMQSDRLFNDSGRMSNISATASADAWRINVPANRLSGDTLDHGGQGALAGMVAKLLELVPELGDATLLMGNDIVRKGIEKAMESMHRKGPPSSSPGGAEVLIRIVEAAVRAFEAVDEMIA